MAGIFNGPARGGTRGGADQFNWDSVKSDQDREYYLGHSVKALTGRWQKGKDVYWYTREKDTGDDADARRRAEMQMVKQREEDLMLEALGMKPKAPKQISQPKLDKEDMQKLMAREEGEGGAQGSDGDNPDRIRGLGFNAARTTGALQLGTDQEIMQGVGLNRPGYDAHPRAGAVPAAAHPSNRSVAGADVATERRLRKEEKKLEKRARKESKRAKKDSKRSRRGRSRSRSRSYSPHKRTSDISGDRDGDGRRERKDRHRDRSPVVQRVRDDTRRRERSLSRSRSRSPRGSRSPRRRSERYEDRGRRGRDRSPSRERRPHRGREVT